MVSGSTISRGGSLRNNRNQCEKGEKMKIKVITVDKPGEDLKKVFKDSFKLGKETAEKVLE